MKTIPVLLVLSFLVLVGACSKDKFETKPRIEIKSYSTKELRNGETLKITLDFFDKEGDINGDSAVAIIIRQNINPLPPLQDKNDVIHALLPDFPEKDQGEIFFQLPWDYLKESLTENDTLIFRFAINDRQGNLSDTINSDKVVILRP